MPCPLFYVFLLFLFFLSPVIFVEQAHIYVLLMYVAGKK